ncbi:MAG: DUF1801 domain-containing protein [Fluviicola sp.]|nr:DUF1801 domain-containing protein [Fluviicola sp.]
MNATVNHFLDALNHPFRLEIDRLRSIILASSPLLSENIKWNGPNYSVEDEDRITMRVHPPKQQVQLIFHRGAKKQMQPQERLISDPSGILVWKENDRAIATFQSLEAIEHAKNALTTIIQSWIQASQS